MSDFDLNQAVADVLDAGGLTDLDQIAAKVAENVPSKHLRAALTVALRSYVRERNGLRRMSNPVLHAGRVQSARSPKVAGYREMHRRFLRDLVHVEGGYKPLGECAYEDLMFAANERREFAARNAAQADRFEWLASKVQEYGVDTVADLPDDVLGGEAA